MIAPSLLLACQLVATPVDPFVPAPLKPDLRIPAQQSPAPLRLTLRGGHRTGTGRSHSYALLQLAADLPKLLAPGPILPPASQQAEAPPFRTPSPPARKARLREDPRLTWLTVQRAGKAVAEALRYQQTEKIGRQLRRLANRARYAAGLPDLRLRAGSSADESLRLSPTLTDPARYTQLGARDLWFDAQLTWHLDRAIFAPEEIAIERLRRFREQDRFELISRVLKTLEKWQKALIAAREPLQLLERRQQAKLQALSAAARLDALTGGWFSRHAPAVESPSGE